MNAAAVNAATQALVRMLRREFDRRKPQGPNPVPSWEEMKGVDRASFIRCTVAALEAAEQAKQPPTAAQ